MYICAPIATRYVLAKQALNTGKHVLCESPVAGNAEGVRDVHRLAGEKGVVLLDGVSLFIPLIGIWFLGRLEELADCVLAALAVPSCCTCVEEDC